MAHVIFFYTGRVSSEVVSELILFGSSEAPKSTRCGNDTRVLLELGTERWPGVKLTNHLLVNG